MPQLKPTRFGKIPDGLPVYQRDFLQWVKDSIEILIGAKRSQKDNTTPPRSQALTYNDLANVPNYSDNEAAKAAGLAAGDLYRTVDTLKVVH